MSESGLVFFLTGIGMQEGERVLASIKEQIDRGDKNIFVSAPIGFELHILDVSSGERKRLEDMNPEAIRYLFQGK